MLDGRPFVIRSGEMHYARIPREYWRDRMKKMRAMGLNTLCMYSFWNMHEPRPGRFDFAGNLDIAAFIRTAQEEGLWVIVRPGPYTCAEWEFGGFPSWLLRDARTSRCARTDPRFLDRGLALHRAPARRSRAAPGHARRTGPDGAGRERVRLLRQGQGLPERHPPDDRGSGIEVPLYTVRRLGCRRARRRHAAATCHSVINFGGAPEREFANYAKFRQSVPLMCGEYWVGWFDHWGEQHHTGDNEVHLAGIDWMLARNISFNLYMVHGGSNLRLHERRQLRHREGPKGYEPTISSATTTTRRSTRPAASRPSSHSTAT